MEAYSIILERNQHDIADDCWYLGVPAQTELSQPKSGQIVSTFSAMAYHLLCRTLDPQQVHLGWLTPDQPISQIILFLPKSKPETLMQLDHARNCLSANGGRLWIVGHNKGGIKSFPSLAKKAGLLATRVDSARHCALFEITIDPGTGILPTHDIPPNTMTSIQLDSGLEIVSCPGVFGHGKLDPGTRLLLTQLDRLEPLRPHARVLDFGCGAGVIGLSVAHQFTNSAIDLVDVNWLACQSARESTARNQMSDVRVLCQDGLNGLDTNYQLIISNPPFHEGIRTHYEVTEKFLDQSIRYLNKNGQMLIVANQFLKYEPVLQKHFAQVTELARQNGFKILYARRQP